jgi:UDP-3-O-[3-hydroxymyristoyl] glucosamine N-acyltransferase
VGNNIALTCEEIAKIAEGKCLGNPETKINNLNGIANAVEGELTFISSEKYIKFFETTQASAIIVPEGYELPEKPNCCYIACKDPYKGFLQVVTYIDMQRQTGMSGISKTSVIGETSLISDTAFIGEGVIIGENCRIGDNCVLKPGVVLYDNIVIGDNSLIHSNAVVYDNSVIGNNVIVHAGAVIGSDGFGNIEHSDGSWTKIPHIGNTVLEDWVEIGANTTIDRAFVGSTIVRTGAKLDNLVQVGHNCDIGEHSAFAGQVGLAGSTKVGKRNRFGGQVGFAGHIESADDVTILAQSGVAQSIKEKGVYLGSPIAERVEQIKILMSLKKLPELVKRVTRMEKKIENGNNK